jgi:UDP-N-acetylmuramyl tripeptide synthase
MKLAFFIFISKLVTFVCKVFKKNGTVLPGNVVYDWFKQKKILEKVKYPEYVIAVTGSSGKGSTTDLVNHILTDAGYDVCYNENGSNGVLAATTLILNNCNFKGEFKHQVLLIECDERHLKLIFGKNKMTHLIITNITRDQPCRHGNHNIVFKDVLSAIGDNTKIIINADDPLVNTVKYNLKNEVITYGVGKTSDSYLVNDINNVDSAYCPKCHRKLKYNFYHYGHVGNYECPNCDFKRGKVDYEATDVDLEKQSVKVNGKKYHLTKDALYAVYFTAAAISLCKTIGISDEQLDQALNKHIKETTRGKVITLDGRVVTMLESKSENNLSFYQSLRYIANQKKPLTICLGFDYVSKRHPHNDVSWLWDIDFELLKKSKIDKIFCIGKFRYDVATRLEFSGLDHDKIVLIDDIDNNLVPELKNSSGDIYTMACIDLTKRLLKLFEGETHENS